MNRGGSGKIDMVPGGGKFDGVLGVIAAVEVLETIIEHDIITEHPLEVIIFVNEDALHADEQRCSSRCAGDDGINRCGAHIYSH